jgi:hypothetical protein
MQAALIYIGSIVLLDPSLYRMNVALSLLASRSSSAEPGFIRFLLLFYFFFFFSDFLFLSVSWRTNPFWRGNGFTLLKYPCSFLHDFAERYELTLLFNPSQQPLFSILLSIFVWQMTV